MHPKAYQPIETPIGILKGRDAIFLDGMDVDMQNNTLTLHGTFNGSLASRPIKKEVAYTLRFSSVLALKVIELDSWDYSSSSSFDEVINSEWCSQLSGKVDESFKHYLVQTYDDVVEVVCHKYTLTLG